MTEFQRLHDLAAGEHWVGDPQRFLYLCLTNAPAKDNHLVEFDGIIPPSYEEAAKLLYQVVGQSDDAELRSFAEKMLPVAQARLQRLVVERKDFDGFCTGDRTVDRAETITRATSEQGHRNRQENSGQAHLSWRACFAGAV